MDAGVEDETTCSWELYVSSALPLQANDFKSFYIKKAFILKRQLHYNKTITSWDPLLSGAVWGFQLWSCCHGIMIIFVCSLMFTGKFMTVLNPSHWFNLRCATNLSDSQRSPKPVFATRCTTVSWSFLVPKGYMCLQRDYLNATNKSHCLTRFLSHSCKPHSFRDLTKDNLIKNLLPFFSGLIN